MAVQHAFTFDEGIPIERLVSEMAVHYQEYTMKAGVRPFGCALLITHYDKLFKGDPSGSVELLDDSNNGYIGKILNKSMIFFNTDMKGSFTIFVSQMFICSTFE